MPTLSPTVRNMYLIEFAVTLAFWGMLISLTRLQAARAEKLRDPIRKAVEGATGIKMTPPSGIGGWIQANWLHLYFAAMVTLMLVDIMYSMLHPGRTKAMRQATNNYFMFGFMAMMLGPVLGWLLWSWVMKQAVGAIRQRLLLGDYVGAIVRADNELRWLPRSRDFHFTRGTTLLLAWRLNEAEQALRTSIEVNPLDMLGGRSSPLRPNLAPLAAALGNLGHTLLALGRWREATATFECTVTLVPAAIDSIEGLASALLRQNLEPRRALGRIDQALELARTAVQIPDGLKHTISYLQADRAQALAMLENFTEASVSLELADVEVTDSVPFQAGILWRRGQALSLMSGADEAATEFARAIEIDPNGLYGKLAANALKACRRPSPSNLAHP